MKRPLTPSQCDHLRRLLCAGAVSPAAAASPYHAHMAGFSPMVMGKLRDLGLADSRAVRPPGGSQHTVYWLTPAGVEQAQALAAEASR